MTIYTDTTRFDACAMTEDEMLKVALSILAVTAHEGCSDRFKLIPTIELLRD